MAIWPVKIHQSRTGFWPTHIKTEKSAINIQKQILNSGRYVVFLISDVLVNDIKNKTNKEPSMTTIPPALWGIDLKIV